MLALLAPALGLTSGSANAYWDLIPQLGAGITWESNPRYLRDNDPFKDPVAGTFAQVGLEGSYKTPANQINLSTSFQQTNFLDSDNRDNQDLNGDNWSVNLGATHEDQRGNIGLSAGYTETPIRQDFVRDPENPNTGGGFGRFSDGTTKSGDLGTFLTYNLSPRNRAALSFGTSEVTYDVPGDRPFNNGYFDYTNDQASLTMSHYLDEKNYFQIALNGGTFAAEEQNGPARNTTDSFGINAAYSHTITETVTASITVGVSRSSVDIRGLPFDPLTGALCAKDALCSSSDEARNFVGDLSISKRSERTTFNFDVSRALTPQSSGTQAVQDQFSFFVQRTLTSRLSGSAGTILSSSSAVGDLGRQDQKYFTLNTTLSWQLTPTLSTYGKYSYISSEDNPILGQANKDTNNSLFFGVTYRGVGLRH